ALAAELVAGRVGRAAGGASRGERSAALAAELRASGILSAAARTRRHQGTLGAARLAARGGGVNLRPARWRASLRAALAREGERRPLADLALDPDPPPVQLHELLGQRQPEPRALLLAGVVPPDLAELLEDRRLILRRDADPRVADGDGDHVVGRRGRSAASAPS